MFWWSAEYFTHLLSNQYQTESKLLPLKLFVQNMQWLVKSVSSSFSKDLSHEGKAKDFKIVLEDEDLSLRTPTLKYSVGA